MTSKPRILYISQNIFPFLPDNPMGKICRFLPQGIQERKWEIRTFMPRFGVINERRNQLHEVIRLSGMNLIINDADHPLIIKVASIQPARMQVYFIDNEDYFSRKYVFRDKGNKFFKDNDERAIFFARGVLETVIKLGWKPDVVHCHGWMTSLIPVFIRSFYKDNPIFADTKIITSLHNDEFKEKLNKEMSSKTGLDKKLKFHKTIEDPSYKNVIKGAIDYSDGIICSSIDADKDLVDHAKASKKPYLDHLDEDTYIDSYKEFYDNLISS